MTSPQPGWYADPVGAHDLRWWDGGRWTDAVVKDAVQGTSPLPDGRAPVQVTGVQGAQPRAGRQGAGTVQAAGGGTLFTEPVLVVEPGPGLVGPTGGHAVRDAAGRPLGSVVEVRRGGPLGTAARLLRRVDQLLTHRIEVRDEQGVPQLLLVRPAAFARSRVVVERPGLGEIGQLVQQDSSGRVRYALHSGGRQVGTLDTQEGQDGQTRDVAVCDEGGVEVARIREGVEGTRVVQVHRPLQDPLLSLVVAGALTVGTALGRGSGG